ncbi:hypothetical protein NW756_009653 [Fusarium oxysporum]|nr:hypothetical protein NW763_012706 [Fusarium oxysporum]KAJ4045189.1 hypothetical protein NW753_009833 [Fusarium oxysporum]KAJ4083452.1 hypothetical protein NW756_009653 [Fusarium oxysporum]
MENNENSEARFAEIKTAVGNPFEVPPSVYMQRLEEETKRDNSLVPFLSKASRVDTTPRQSPKSWLEKLATTDFVSVGAVCRLDLDLVVNNIGYFDLLINDEATYTVAPYPDVLGPWTTN